MSKEIQYLNINTAISGNVYTVPAGKVVEVLLTNITIGHANAYISIGGNQINGVIDEVNFAQNSSYNSFANSAAKNYRRRYFMGAGQAIYMNTYSLWTSISAILVIEDIGVQ